MINKTLLSTLLGFTLFLPIDLQAYFQTEAVGIQTTTQEDKDYLSHLMELTINFFGILDEEDVKEDMLSTTTVAAEEKNNTLVANKLSTNSNELNIETEQQNAETERLKEEAEQAKIIDEWLNSFPEVDPNSKQETFIRKIAPSAVFIANEYGIYPSVMIAQAALESSWGQSNLATEYNNLMGTKGSYNGESVTMNTREDVGGESVYINAGFSVYDSWGASLARYGSLMRNGLEWNAEFYQGTWRENTNSYTDATAWLQGRYASDTSYASKLNGTIASFNLEQYDSIESIEIDFEEFLNEVVKGHESSI